MRRARLLLVVTLATAGCAGINRVGGVGGAPAVSGATQDERARTGAATDSLATNGSVTTGDSVPRPTAL